MDIEKYNQTQNIPISPSQKRWRILSGALFGAIFAAVFIILVTIVGELYKPLKNILKEWHYHHWIGKGIWSVIVFVFFGISYWFFKKNPTDTHVGNLLRVLSWALLSVLIILFVFFVYEFYIYI